MVRCIVALASALALLAALSPATRAQSPATIRVSVTSDGSQSNGSSGELAISGDGRFVAFTSDATNLVAGDTNGLTDVFVRDRLLGRTVRVSESSDGQAVDSARARP